MYGFVDFLVNKMVAERGLILKDSRIDSMANRMPSRFGMNDYSDLLNSESDMEKIEILRRRKVIVKSEFIEAVFRLTCAFEGEVDRQHVVDSVERMIEAHSKALVVMVRLSEAFQESREIREMHRVGEEMDQIETEFAEAVKHAKNYLHHSSLGPRSCTASIRPCDKEQRDAGHEDSGEVRRQLEDIEKQVIDVKQRLHVYEDAERKVRNRPDSREADTMSYINHQGIEGNLSCKNLGSASKESVQRTEHTESLGVDMWSQLKRIAIPTFYGDKSSYQSWRSAFMQCIDRAPATPEYKLLQLRQCLAGEALQSIQELAIGHSPAAYESAKTVLERKFGGRRRQAALCLEKLEKYSPMCDGSAQEMEAFADMLEAAVQKLKEAGRTQELGDGVLYSLLQQKLSVELVTSYHRWLFVNQKLGSVETLLEWVMRETELMVIGQKAVQGVSSRFAAVKNSVRCDSSACIVCGDSHDIVVCNRFIQMAVHQRWDIARLHKLCFRCLGRSHFGQDCPQTRACRIDECSLSHHRMLHKSAQH